MKKFKRIMLAGLSAVMIVTSVGCAGDDEAAVIDKGSGEIPETLSIYAPISNYALKAGAKDNNDTLYFQTIEELTGCHVEWIHPAVGADEEKFNLTIASGNLPDMMVASWSTIQGGAKMYADDAVIIPLKELMEENMPNLVAYNKEKPQVAKQYIDDSGEVYYIPFIRKDEQLKVFQGPQIRQDWLEKLGLEVPKTPEELYNVL
ncbi:MAG: extracellular solute-binding protein, partial [Clostridia bacterium]|nr:extracellular solute-binding protein [Clostridia bacterium]